MEFENKFDGIAYVKVTSAYPAGTLQKIQIAGICLYDISFLDAFTIRFSAKRRDIRRIYQICEKLGSKVEVEGWTGYIFYIVSLIKRPVFLAGILIWLFFALWLPTRILFVEVEGNATLPDAYILESASDCGIRMWASGRKVRSEQMKNALLSKIPSLHWAGVNTKGCVATIRVKEKSSTVTPVEKVAVTDIIAGCDAIVKEVTVHSGTALCQPGQAVKNGQALISCYRDNGQFLEFTGALGEVYGETKRKLTVITPAQVFKRTGIKGIRTNFRVIIGKKSINFCKDSGILDGTCVKMYKVKEVYLPGGFKLPIQFVTEQVIQYDIEPIALTNREFSWLHEYAQSYLQSSLVAGNVLSAQTALKQSGDVYYLTGTYDCHEMIADFEYKGITQNNGEDD